MLRVLIVVAALVGLGALTYARIVSQPLPRFNESHKPPSSRAARGAFHVHSDQSHDSSLSLDTIAQAAKDLGHQFVVLTDHNKQLAGTMIRQGIVLISGAELSTPFGHLISLDAHDVLGKEDRKKLDLHHAVKELGGIPIVAHPSDPKRPWEGTVAGANGIEITNFAASLRRKGGPVFVGLLPTLLAWKSSPALALAQIYDRDESALARWDGERGVDIAGYCGTNTHGRFDLGLSLSTWQLVLVRPIPDDPEAAAETIIASLRAGTFHCAAGAFGTPRTIDFHARTLTGQRVDVGAGGPVHNMASLHFEMPEVVGSATSTHLLRNGEEVLRHGGTKLTYPNPMPGTYRIEVRAVLPGVLWGDRVVPIVYTNRIRVRTEAEHAAWIAAQQPVGTEPGGDSEPVPQPAPEPVEGATEEDDEAPDPTPSESQGELPKEPVGNEIPEPEESPSP